MNVMKQKKYWVFLIWFAFMALSYTSLPQAGEPNKTRIAVYVRNVNSHQVAKILMKNVGSISSAVEVVPRSYSNNNGLWFEVYWLGSLMDFCEVMDNREIARGMMVPMVWSVEYVYVESDLVKMSVRGLK